MPGKLFDNFTILTMAGAGDDLDLIESGAIEVDSAGTIVWIGASADFPGDGRLELETIDGAGQLLSPGLIDCHTHLVFGGSRVLEWKRRLEGASYEEIARQGGGIRSTVRATRAASEMELYETACQHARFMLSQGVTTLEVKSGYGLSCADEEKLLRVASRINEETPLDIAITFLGAHSIPEEFAGHPNQYLDLVINEMLPMSRQYAEAVDVFCERIAFDLPQAQRVLLAAQELEMGTKIHAEQLSLTGSAAWAAGHGAWSADHLEYLDDQGVAALAESNAVAVLLPGAFYFIGEKQLPPVKALRAAGVPMAIATDFNPGSSPVVSLPLIMNLACTLFGLTPAEAWRGVTSHAAAALRRSDSIGSLQPGMLANFAVWDLQSPEELAYFIGHQPCLASYRRGEPIYRRSSETV